MLYAEVKEREEVGGMSVRRGAALRCMQHDLRRKSVALSA